MQLLVHHDGGDSLRQRSLCKDAPLQGDCPNAIKVSVAAGRKQIDFEQLSDRELMDVRVRDLNLRVEGSVLESRVEQLCEELEAKGLAFRPPCYLADEWLCPDKQPIVGIPFYLAHHRLERIEQRMMFEVEGGTEKWCMKLLRHECGHAINYAYELFKKTRWRDLFGPFSARYSDKYEYQPYSRRFVMHLEGHYAQAHPDEDFAETFAVWLAPNGNWKDKYGSWPVIKKLSYVDGIMQRIGAQPPVVTARGTPPWSASRMRSTLRAYYDRKRKALGSQFRGYYDDSLKELFGKLDGSRRTVKADKLVKSHRREMVDSVARWTGHRKYDIHQLITRLAHRCDALDLYGLESNTDSIVSLTALLTAIASNTYHVEGRP